MARTEVANLVEERRRQTDAATRLQARQRGGAGRQHAAALRREAAEQQQREEAATLLQALHRGSCGRADAAERAETARRQQEAAVRLQALQRGKMGREEAWAIEYQERLEAEAATRLQARHRGIVGRHVHAHGVRSLKRVVTCVLRLACGLSLGSCEERAGRGRAGVSACGVLRPSPRRRTSHLIELPFPSVLSALLHCFASSFLASSPADKRRR